MIWTMVYWLVEMVMVVMVMVIVVVMVVVVMARLECFPVVDNICVIRSVRGA